VLFHALGKKQEGLIVKEHLPRDCLLFDGGCGDGTFSHNFSDSVVGLDLDPVEIAPFSGHAIIGSLANIPIRSGVFSYGLSNSVMEHVPSLDASLMECGRILKSGGIFVITVPNGVGVVDSLLKVIYRIENMLTENDWKKKLVNSGFSIIKTVNYLPIIQRRIYVLTCIFPPLIICNWIFIKLLERVKGKEFGAVCLVSRKV